MLTPWSEAGAERGPVGNDHILFLSLARDCEATVAIFLRFLRQLDESGFRVSALIGENGSHDGTRHLLDSLQWPLVQMVDTSQMESGATRLQRMAIGRQLLLDRARSLGLGEGYVCVADLDNVMQVPPTPAMLRSAITRLNRNPSLFAVGATSLPVFYDLLALRAEGHDYSSLAAEIEAAKRRPWRYYQFHRERIYADQRRMTLAVAIPCVSSFNGLCLYRASDFYTGSYRAASESEVCEHVTMNLQIAAATGKSMMIAPELILKAPADHIPMGQVRFWTDRIVEQIKQRLRGY